MITKYFTRVTVKFDPFASSAKTARLFLSRVPLGPGKCKIDYKVLTAQSPASDKPVVEVTYKDKFVLAADPATMTFKELSAHFDAHSRQLAIKDAISD